MQQTGARPFTRTTTGDAYDTGTAGQAFTCLGFALKAGVDAATAVFTDANGVVLASLGVGIQGSVNCPIPTVAVGKVTVTITGTTPTAIVYVQ